MKELRMGYLSTSLYLPMAYGNFTGRFLWTTENSFVFPAYDLHTFHRLCVVTLFSEDESYNTEYLNISHCIGQILNTQTRYLYHPFVGGFFTAPQSDFFYLISNCPKNHEHHRLNFIHKSTLELTAFLDIAGDILSIGISFSEIIIAVLKTNYRLFKSNSAFSTLSENPEKWCCLAEPWFSKRTAQKIVNSVNIERIDFDGGNYQTVASDVNFIDPCLEGINYNKMTELNCGLYRCFVYDCIHSSRDFITLNNDAREKTLIFGRNHSFYTDVKAYVANAHKKLQLLYHPTEPLMLTQSGQSEYFKLYLLTTATTAERTSNPECHDTPRFCTSSISWKRRLI